LYQNILLWLLTWPIAFAVQYGGSSHLSNKWDIYDTICTLVFLTVLAGETIADNQQWAFQTQKYALLNGGTTVSASSSTPLRRSKRKATIENTLSSLPGEYSLGFITTGLFKYSRHPNFFCEISLWFTQLAFIAARPGFTSSPFLVASIGAILLFLLFLGSTTFTEWISTQKYPKYKDYQKTTSMLVPWCPGAALYGNDKSALAKEIPGDEVVEYTPTKRATRSSARGTPRTPRSAKKKD
jgi:steroid 5-alpha reductase family enzyme